MINRIKAAIEDLVAANDIGPVSTTAIFIAPKADAHKKAINNNKPIFVACQ